MKTYAELKREILSDPEIKAEYDNLEPEYALIRQVIEARRELNWTQKELAERMGIQQSHISRLESGNYNPSLAFLKRVSKALGKKITLTIG
ncbi:MAG: helix-turn-helix transcriptional regulator [Planctomycetia bacterium]|nr:helix-turn-helix transcriptional regulator [Planctomycetia bacterium]